MFEIQGKVAIVTGGNSGIGLEVTKALLAKGAYVMMVGRGEGKMIDVWLELDKEYPSKVAFFVADVSVASEMKRAVQNAVTKFGKLDIMVANAGVDIAKPHSSEFLDEARTVIDVNLMGAYYSDLFAIEQMVKQGTGGVVINTSSVASYRGIMGHVMYSASKHGLVGLTIALSNEYRNENIRVNSIAPGGVETGMGIANLPEDVKKVMREKVLATQPRGFAMPDEIAHAIIFAIENEQLTGSNVIIDGGLGSLFRTMGQ